MKKYISANAYCSETGFPRTQMDKLLHSFLGAEFSYRSGQGKTSPYYIIIPVFERMLEAGEFREILES